MKWVHVAAEGPLYEASRVLRGKVLREPLGMGSTVEVFPFEHESRHFLALQEEQVVGCVLLHPRGDEGKLYQMAVHPDCRGQGIGTQLVEKLESYASGHGIKLIFCNSRHYAVSYYEMLGYGVVGEPFEEIGMQHFRMEKVL